MYISIYAIVRIWLCKRKDVFHCVKMMSFLFATNTDFHEQKSLTTHSGQPVIGYRLESPRTVLWSQIPTDPANATLAAVQYDSIYPFDADLVDDVDPDSTGWEIDSVRAWLGGWGGFVWSAVVNVRFLVYEDSLLASPHPVDSPLIEIIIEPSHYTATEIAYEKYIVDMELPTTVFLEAGKKYWIECQPTNVFTNNGQSGWTAEVGIGNGQEFYQRFPEVGIDIWESATSIHGSAMEVGFELIGNYFQQNVLFVDDDANASYESYFETSFNNLGIATINGRSLTAETLHRTPVR
jgi:hypothetical protein